MTSLPTIYLNSRSPHRRALLEQLGVSYEVLTRDADEQWDGSEPAPVHVVRLALAKARLGWRAVKDTRPLPVLAADTAVVLDDEILGKAETQHQAMTMLRRLSGRSHWVYSGVAVVDLEGGEHSAMSASRICMRPLSIDELRAYCDSGEPLSRAGGYAIQGRAAQFIERLEGSYSGVVGLPLYETARLLMAAKARAGSRALDSAAGLRSNNASP